MDVTRLNTAQLVLGLFDWLAELSVDENIPIRVQQLELELIHFQSLLQPNDREIAGVEKTVADLVLKQIKHQMTFLRQFL